MLDLDDNRDPLVSEAVADALDSTPDATGSAKSQTGVLLVIVSLALFVGGQAMVGSGDWAWIVALVAVLLVHELGHLAAMRLFGFSDLNVFFIPFLGAAATGRKFDATATQQAVVSLAGPVPGVVAGLILAFTVTTDTPLVWTTINLLVLINLFNLLPSKPLDGGRFLDIVLFSRQPELQVVVSLLGAGLLGYLAYALGSWLLGALAVYALLTTDSQRRHGLAGLLIRRQLGDELVASERIPVDQREAVARAVEVAWGAANIEKTRPRTMAMFMNRAWQRAMLSPAPLGATLALLLVYLATIAVGAWLLFAA